MKRMTRDEYYLSVLDAVRKRSTCDRGRSGAIIVKDNRIVTTGYVGAPTGISHCDEVGHLFQISWDEEGISSKHCVGTVHAELNAILQAACSGVNIERGTMYCTMTPCFECAKAIVNVGIVEVVATHPYQSQERTIELFNQVGIRFNLIDSEEGLY